MNSNDMQARITERVLRLQADLEAGRIAVKPHDTPPEPKVREISVRHVPSTGTPEPKVREISVREETE